MNDTHAPDRALLDQLAPATDLAGLHRLLELRAEQEGLLDVSYRTIDSPLGSLLLAATPTGLVRVAFDREGFDTVLASLATRLGPRVLRAPARLDDAARQLDEYFAGTRTAFDLPLVGGTTTDYLPAPRNPGLFEVPVGSALVTGTPLLLRGDRRFAAGGLPVELRHEPGRVHARYEGFPAAGHLEPEPPERDHGRSAEVLGGTREVTWRVEGRTLTVEEQLTFDQVPDSVTLQVTEANDRPLAVRFHSDAPHRTATVDTSGLAEYRSCWGELPRVHQIEQVLAQERAKGLGRIDVQADVLVHVKGLHPRPVEVLLLGEGGEELVLRGRRGEHHPHVGLFGHQRPHARGDIERRGAPHLRATGVHLDRQAADGQGPLGDRTNGHALILLWR